MSAREALICSVDKYTDEIDKLNAKISAQAKAEAKAREAFAALQQDHGRLEEQLQGAKSEYESSIRDMQVFSVASHRRATSAMLPVHDSYALPIFKSHRFASC